MCLQLYTYNAASLSAFRCSHLQVHTRSCTHFTPSLPLPAPPMEVQWLTRDQRCFYSQRQTSVRAVVHAWFSLYREETRNSSMTGLISAGLHALCGGPQARPGTATQENSHQLPRAQQSLRRYPTTTGQPSSPLMSQQTDVNTVMRWHGCPRGQTDTGASARARSS